MSSVKDLRTLKPAMSQASQKPATAALNRLLLSDRALMISANLQWLDEQPGLVEDEHTEDDDEYFPSIGFPQEMIESFLGGTDPIPGILEKTPAHGTFDRPRCLVRSQANRSLLSMNRSDGPSVPAECRYQPTSLASSGPQQENGLPSCKDKAVSTPQPNQMTLVSLVANMWDSRLR